jgi:hypothetical protein
MDRKQGLEAKSPPLGASFGEAESLPFAPQRGAKKHLFSKKRTDKLFFY